MPCKFPSSAMVRRLPSPPLMHDLPQNSCPQDRNSNQLQRPGTIAACMPQPWPISEQGNMRPPTTVPQTGTLSSSAGSTNRGSSSRIAKSARLPHSIEPSSVSSLRVNAAPMVTAYRAYASPIFEDCRGLGAGRCATDGRDRDLVVPGARSCGTGLHSIDMDLRHIARAGAGRAGTSTGSSDGPIYRKECRPGLGARIPPIGPGSQGARVIQPTEGVTL